MKTNNFKALGMKYLSFVPIGIVVVIFGAIAIYSVEANSPENVSGILKEKGFTNIEVGGHVYISCPKNSPVKRNFTAEDKNGNRVKGYICDGSFLDFANRVETEIIELKKTTKPK